MSRLAWSVVALGLVAGCGSSAGDDGDATGGSSGGTGGSSGASGAPAAGASSGGASSSSSSGGSSTSGSSGGSSSSSSSGGSSSSSSSGGSSSSSSSGGSSSGGSSSSGGIVVGDEPLPLPACDAESHTTTTLPTGVDWNKYGAYDVGPLLPRGARTSLFLDGTFWSVAENGTMATNALPDVLAGNTLVIPQRSASGYSSVLFQKAGSWFASAYANSAFGAPLPLMAVTGSLEGRVAGDGHHWIRHAGTFFEQTASGLVNRGAGPAGGTWDVLADGTVVIVALPASAPDEVVVWRLLPGATAWAQQTALTTVAVAAFAAEIENGFEPATATIAADGSVHVFTAAHCIGEGQRNRAQAYARYDGTDWQVEMLSSADLLTGELRTWNQAALWAGDREHVRFVYTSSTQPTNDGWNYVYPERKYDVVSRCRLASGELSFARIGRVRHPEWTQRGFASFSETGVATLLTKSLGLTQVW